jgi:hypothetical protein
MKWIKKGQIFKPNGEFDWMNLYTTPIAAMLLEDRIRVYFSTRSKLDVNGNYISYATFIDLNKRNPKEIIHINDKPLLELGSEGMFDEYGIMIAKPVIVDSTVYLYYMGWQRLAGKAPYQVMLGLAKSFDMGMSFFKESKGPVLGIDTKDPISIGNVCVLHEDGLWKMWYTSYIRWSFNGIKPTPEYNIKYAESRNGVDWNKTNIVCIEEDEKGGIATPSVIKKDNIYHMWFGYRPDYSSDGKIAGYSIGYAKSLDGINWKRDDDNSGISASNTGWDADMVCYPHVIECDGNYLMFYCGNGFGETGFGYALLEGGEF